MGGAYGGGKAGGAFNPITFVQRPQVLLRAACWVSDNWFINVYHCVPLCTIVYPSPKDFVDMQLLK